MARALVDGMSMLHDPAANISPSLWERVVPLLRELDSALRKLDDPAIDSLCVRLEREPYDAATRAALEQRLLTVLPRAPASAGRCLVTLLHTAEFGRLLPHGGPDRVEGDAPALADQLAALERLRAAPYHRCDTWPDMTIVLSFRCRDDAPHRRRNLLCCVAALLAQTVPRSRYALVAVEQDREPRLAASISPLVDHYLFAPNPGAFNYAWGRNVGVGHGPAAPLVCLLDTDVVVAPTFIESLLSEFAAGASAVLPYDRALCLDEWSSGIVARSLARREALPSVAELRGYVMSEVYGFAVATTREIYDHVGGQDERYRDWGDEDNEFHARMREHARVRRTAQWVYHLDHPRPQMRQDGVRLNAAAISTPRLPGGPFGALDRYASDLEHERVERG